MVGKKGGEETVREDLLECGRGEKQKVNIGNPSDDSEGPGQHGGVAVEMF